LIEGFIPPKVKEPSEAVKVKKSFVNCSIVLLASKDVESRRFKSEKSPGNSPKRIIINSRRYRFDELKFLTRKYIPFLENGM
jgi:hypothetical protein